MQGGKEERRKGWKERSDGGRRRRVRHTACNCQATVSARDLHKYALKC